MASKIYRKDKINLATLPPALLSVFPKISLSSLKLLVIAGDTCEQGVMDYLSINRWLINAYGPTECTVCVSMQECTKGDSVTKIGKPIPNARCYILDDKQKPCPIYVAGELYVGGAGLARGYFNQPELTAEKFIENPFATEEDKKLGCNLRLYKTGDMVRWLPDGNLEFIGRIDDQAKIRGFRIELGEIESVLAKHRSISRQS